MNFEKAYELYKSYYTVNFKQRSIESANSVFPLYILPYFKNYNIQEIEKTHILQWEEMLDQKDLSYKYKKDIYVFLAMFFRWFERYNNLDRNVVSEVGFILKNKEVKKEIVQVWTISEFKKFIKYVDDPVYKVFFKFLFFTGCRLGEAIALNFSDINLSYISISKTSIRGNGKTNSPKTESSNRKIKIDHKLLKEINYLKKYYIKKYGYFDNNFFIFGGKKNLSYTTATRKKNKACEKANIKKIRLHDFRHSHVTLLLSKGIPAKAVCSRVGHKDVSMTLNVYAHILKTDEKRLMRTITLMRIF